MEQQALSSQGRGGWGGAGGGPCPSSSPDTRRSIMPIGLPSTQGIWLRCDPAFHRQNWLCMLRQHHVAKLAA